MRLTTLCYIEKEGSYLMMHRIKKQQDENAGKWIGIGGHMKEDETPEECVRREILEETGLTVDNLKLRGILTFILPAWGNELTFLYTASTKEEVSKGCSEGVLKWIPIDEIMDLPLWEGDRVFLPLLREEKDCFYMKLIYDKEDNLENYLIEV